MYFHKKLHDPSLKILENICGTNVRGKQLTYHILSNNVKVAGNPGVGTPIIKMTGWLNVSVRG